MKKAPAIWSARSIINDPQQLAKILSAAVAEIW
jgi:hypothetical protein